jgi:hypothetical protein
LTGISGKSSRRRNLASTRALVFCVSSFDQTLEAYDAFSKAAGTQAPKVAIAA